MNEQPCTEVTGALLGRLMRRTVAMLCSVGALHCAPSDVLHLPFPPIETGSMILGVDQTSGQRSFSVRAFDVSGDASERLPLLVVERGEEVTIDALLYPRPLIDFNLDEGLLVEADAGGPVRALPDSDSVQRLQLPAGDPTWAAVDTPNAKLQRLRVVDPEPRDCATLVAAPFALGDQTNTEFAVALGPDEALVSQQSGRLLRWTPEGLEMIRVTPSVALSHGVKDDVEGGWWFITRQGRLYRGTFDTPTELSLTFYAQSFAPGITGRHRIVVRHDDEPQIFSVRSSGLFERFDSTGATVLHTFGDADFGQHTVLTPEGEVVAAASGSALTAIVTTDGRLVLEAAPSDAGFTASAYVEGIGTVLGSSDGRFFARANGRWTEIGRSPLEVFPYAVAAYAGGFVYGGAFGAGGQYLPEGYCTLQDQLAAFTIQWLIPVSGGMLAFGQNPNVPDTPGQLIRFE